jgi:hypothetical protein
MLMKVFGLSLEQATAITLLIPGLVKAEMQASGGVMPGTGATLNSADQAKAPANQATAQLPPEIEAVGMFFWNEIAPRLQALGIDPLQFPQIPIQGQTQPGAQQGPGMMQGTPMQGQNRGTPLQGTGIPPQAAAQGGRLPWINETDTGKPYGIFTDASGIEVMLDSIEMDIQADSIKYDGGILTGDAVMTAAMVQGYKKGGKDKRVLKCPDELKKACDFYPAPMPITQRHPKEGIVMSQDEIKGWTTPPQWSDEKKHVACSVRITDGELIKDVQEGKTDVSIGFFCDLEEKAGKYNDEDYEAIQRNIVFNHLAAGLDKGHGRCPDGKCGVQTGDETDTPRTEEERAMSHFNITKEAWNKLSPEQKENYKKKLPPRGTATGGTDTSKQEATPMTEENKQEPKKDETVPEPKADKTKANPPAGAPQKDEAANYVETMIADERKKLVDAIMDAKPPRSREHYDKLPLGDLRDLNEFLTSVRPAAQVLPAGTADEGDARKKINDAYEAAERKLQGY